jgi:hypothetical protein
MRMPPVQREGDEGVLVPIHPLRRGKIAAVLTECICILKVSPKELPLGGKG